MGKLFPEIGGPLNKRDAWAATFEHLLMGTELRSDCPTTLPNVPPPPAAEMDRQLELPIDEHAEGVIRMLCGMVGIEHGCGEMIKTYADYAPWVTKTWDAWMNRQG